MSSERFVLTFHRVVDRRDREHDVSWDSFRAVLDELAGMPVVTDLALDSDGSAAVLTFDDGTDDHLKVAEELAARALRGIFFVSVDKLGSPRYLAERDVSLLASAGHVIGSHGVSHVRLEQLDPTQLRREVAGSRDRLEELAGREVSCFAPPGGSRHPLLRGELERSGYTSCRSMRWGIHRSRAESLDIPCIPVTELTIARGWVSRALAQRRLPLAMRATYAAKELLPARGRAAVRRRVAR
jgi:peptidoglycan/xylan/chitin deacetylase (PgdA/CDA1 family)